MKALPVALALALPIAAAWRRLESPHFELVTDAGERTARTLLQRLEQIHSYAASQGGERTSPLPVRVYLFSSERDFAPLRQTPSTRGFFQGGPDRNYIAMLDGPDIHRVAFHEYAHLVLNHTAHPFPRWFEEGLAEYFSTLEAGDGRLRIGGVIPSHVRFLSHQPWMHAESMLAASRHSTADDSTQFYAQSWAVVHLLYARDRYRTKIDAFAQALSDGRSQAAAIEFAFGVTALELVNEARAYVVSGYFAIHEMPWEPPAAAAIVLRDLEGAKADLVRVELLLALKKDDIAEELLRRHGGRTTSESAAALGYLELSRRRFDLARAHFERAIASGGAEAAPYFEYAMLLRETGADAEMVESNLRKALERNPNHAEAHFLLGLAASQQDRHEDAMLHLERAAAILPRQSYFWHALAMARHRTGRVEEARRAAWRAREAATTPQERERADAAIELTGAPAAAPVAQTRPAVVVPESWRNRLGDSKVEGTLEHVDCLGRAARLRVRSGGRTFVLAVEQPGKVVLNSAGGGNFEFACGPQASRPIAVEYLAAKPAGAIDGEVTAIELK